MGDESENGWLELLKSLSQAGLLLVVGTVALPFVVLWLVVATILYGIFPGLFRLPDHPGHND